MPREEVAVAGLAAIALGTHRLSNKKVVKNREIICLPVIDKKIVTNSPPYQLN
ncbi:MAG: hypothetical protein RR138_05665 [Akkermansia sp.]